MQVKNISTPNRTHFFLALICFTCAVVLLGLVNTHYFWNLALLQARPIKLISPSIPTQKLRYQIEHPPKVIYARPAQELIYYYLNSNELTHGDFFYLSTPTQLYSAELKNELHSPSNSLVSLKLDLEIMKNIKEVKASAERKRVPPLSKEVPIREGEKTSENKSEIPEAPLLTKTSLPDVETKELNYKNSNKLAILYLENRDLIFGEYGICSEASCEIKIDCDKKELSPNHWNFTKGQKIFLTSKLKMKTQLACTLYFTGKIQGQESKEQQIFIGPLTTENTARLINEKWQLQINN